uniref:Uncharacterized protein n=1 Tax=Rhizophora mucronata TaxID=61149 RepID=A0A2P2MXZ5_RHIMU
MDNKWMPFLVLALSCVFFNPYF